MSEPKTVGGQAVIEGVMMRTPTGWAVAIRAPSGTIEAKSADLPRLSSRSRLARVPFVRGVMVLGESLTLGMKALTWSAQRAAGEDEEPLSRWQLVTSITVALVVFGALFIAGPALAARWVVGESDLAFGVVEGLIRVGLFVAYVWAIGRSAEIRRVFQYHGAEHKTIHAYEDGKPLSVGEVQVYRPEHPRCGTSFLLIVLLASIIVFTFIGRPGVVIEIASRVVLIPAIAGGAYELLRFSGLRSDRWIGRFLAAPGLWLQRLTTAEPEDPMIEVAVASLLVALDEESAAEVKSRGGIAPGALSVEMPPDG